MRVIKLRAYVTSHWSPVSPRVGYYVDSTLVQPFLTKKPFMGSILVSVRPQLQYGLCFVGYNRGNRMFKKKCKKDGKNEAWHIWFTLPKTLISQPNNVIVLNHFWCHRIPFIYSTKCAGMKCFTSFPKTKYNIFHRIWSSSQFQP